MLLEKRFSRKLVISFLVLLLIATYSFTWLFRYEFGLTVPMANIRYFSYGSVDFPDGYSIESKRDERENFLYILYYPLYSVNRLINRVAYADDKEIHWSDRKGL